MLPELEITPSGSRGFSHTAMLKSRGDRGIRAQTRFSRGPPSPPRSQFRPLHHCALLAEPCPDVSSPFLSSPSPCYHLLYTQISFFIGIKLSLWTNWEELMNLQSLFLGIFYFSICSNFFFNWGVIALIFVQVSISLTLHDRVIFACCQFFLLKRLKVLCHAHCCLPGPTALTDTQGALHIHCWIKTY